jgi:hypothetical protein
MTAVTKSASAVDYEETRKAAWALKGAVSSGAPVVSDMSKLV